MSDKKKICIACGGTAGHIFPGLSLAGKLAENYGGNIEISFLTTDNEFGRELLKKSGFEFDTLPLRSLKAGSFRETFDSIYSLIIGSLKSMRIIISKRPDCFVGFGAYAAGPPFVASSILGVPTLIHEQNAVMGRANRIMKGFADKVALSFPEETSPRKAKLIVTGNPIRESVLRIHNKKEARNSLGLNPDRFTVLIVGGSQGSRKINEASLNMLKMLSRELKNKMQVIHLSGTIDYEEIKKQYENLDISYRLFPFHEDMSIVFSAADIAISRAGASVIFELCAHRIPPILIPYPFADGHQFYNAAFLEKRGAALVIEERTLREDSLRLAVERLFAGENLRNSIREKMGMIARLDAADKLADEVGNLAGLSR